MLFNEILIPEAVYSETVIAGHEIGGAKIEVSAASWIRIIPIQDRLAVDVLLDELDLGEAETIVLARELSADLVLMDERKGRRKLTQLSMPKIGTLGILLKAKQLGMLPKIGPDIELLRKDGFSVSQRVVDTILEQAGEA